jgi:hypothetical protein
VQRAKRRQIDISMEVQMHRTLLRTGSQPHSHKLNKNSTGNTRQSASSAPVHQTLWTGPDFLFENFFKSVVTLWRIYLSADSVLSLAIIRTSQISHHESVPPLLATLLSNVNRKLD